MMTPDVRLHPTPQLHGCRWLPRRALQASTVLDRPPVTGATVLAVADGGRDAPDGLPGRTGAADQPWPGRSSTRPQEPRRPAPQPTAGHAAHARRRRRLDVLARWATAAIRRGAASRSSEATPSISRPTAPQWSGAMNGPVELTALLGPHRERSQSQPLTASSKRRTARRRSLAGHVREHHAITPARRLRRRPRTAVRWRRASCPRTSRRYVPDEAGDCVLEALLHGRSRSRALGSLPTPRCPATCLRCAVGGAGPTARGRRRGLQLDKHRHADTARARAAAERRSGVRPFGRGTEP